MFSRFFSPGTALRQRLADLWRQWPWIYPRGIEPSARRWIERAQQQAGWYAGLRGAWAEEVYPGGLKVHPLPDGLPPAARPQFFEVAARRFPPAAVFYLSGAGVVGCEGRVLTPDNRLLAEFYHRFGTGTLRATVRGRPFALSHRQTRRIADPVALLAAPEGANYYHWLFDVLPRLHLLERWQSAIALYAVKNPLSGAQLESLRLLGIGESRLLGLQPGQRLRCQHLYVPSLPGSEGCYPPWSLRFLRDTFLPCAAAVPGHGPRIYIRRGVNAARPILNEAGLIARLERRGFKIVSPENHGFLEQVAIFRDARCVVAAHGAGLANLVFATPRTAVLELFSPDYLRPDCYFTLSRRHELAYDFWLDDVPAGQRQPWGAIVADLAAIEQKIDRLEQTP